MSWSARISRQLEEGLEISLRLMTEPASSGAGAVGIASVGTHARASIVSVVGTIGFEPTTSTMSRWRSNQLSYVPACAERVLFNLGDPIVTPDWCRERDSNPHIVPNNGF